MHVPDHLKPTLDMASIGATVAALIDMLPAATAVLSFVWMLIRIYETDTIQKLIARWRKKRERNPDS